MDQKSQAPGQQQQSQRPAPVYDPSNGGHYGASAALAAQGFAPVPELYTGTWANVRTSLSDRRKISVDERQVNQGLSGTYRDILTTYWQHTISALETDNHDYKIHQLPLARIKKVMKADPEVKMISAEAPILFAKGCDIFITELTMRAWIHAEENKRRTLQRSDIASALAKSDMFDFLIDIVPREEAAAHAKRPPGQGQAGGPGPQPSGGAGVMNPPNNVPQHLPAHPQQQHHMGPSDYSSLSSNPIPQEQEYRQPGMYAPQVPTDPASAYGQPQQPMFNEMYNYQAMAPQQIYQVNQRAQDPSGPQNTGHQYPRHEGGEGDADAEGDRDYEV